jgi:hypothetical protein
MEEYCALKIFHFGTALIIDTYVSKVSTELNCMAIYVYCNSILQ